MHLHDLNTALKDKLVRYGLGPMRKVVTLTGQMLGWDSANLDSSQNFTTTYQEDTIDITCGILNQDIVLRSSIPPLPTKGGRANQQGNVTIQIANAARYLSTIGDGSILDYFNIQDSVLEIKADISGDELPLFKGKVVKQPLEEKGRTTFDARSILWDIIDIELPLELGGAISPGYEVNSAGYPVATPSIDNGVTYHHGITVLDQFGRVVPSLTNSDPEKISVSKIDFVKEGDRFPVLGKYTIEFLDAENFILTQPENLSYLGNINLDFSSGFVSIDKDAWSITEDPTGAKFEFFCSYVAIGNPITIVKHLVYKSLSGNWGEAFTEDSTLSVNWQKLNCLEKIFNGWKVYITETNKDNEVFSTNSTDKPLRIKDFIQKILDHCVCQLRFDASGNINVNASGVLCDGEVIRLYDSCHVSEHSIFGADSNYDKLTIKYGKSILSGDYAGRREFADKAKLKYDIFETSFDYFKIGLSNAEIDALECSLWRYIKQSDIRLKMKLLPQWGLPVEPGDKFEASFSVQPILPNTRTGLGKYWEVYNVNKRVGGYCEVEARMIREVKQPVPVCVFSLCNDYLA